MDDDTPDPAREALREALLPIAEQLVRDWVDQEEREQAAELLADIAAAEAANAGHTHTDEQNQASMSLGFACQRELIARGRDEDDDELGGDASELCDKLEDQILAAARVIQQAPKSASNT